MKIFEGKVVKKKMDKTATIGVERVVAHPLYKKRYKRTKNYHVHDELGVEVGQSVKFVASKPFSKLKRWKVTEILGAISPVEPQSAGKKKAGKAKKTTVSKLKAKSK